MTFEDHLCSSLQNGFNSLSNRQQMGEAGLGERWYVWKALTTAYCII